MEISPLNSLKFSSTVPFSKNQVSNYEVSAPAAYLPRVSAKQYLAFTGGYSMSLKETVENLKESSYPPDIKAAAEKEVAKGNPENKTLIDIHKEKYGKINRMKSLDEVKEAFPEFEGVLSDTEVEYSSNSFMDDFKNDKLEWFDSDTDLSLQLLQMYWADGFSLSDLKEYTNGKNIGGVLEKLNIPRMDRTYGNVLKLSDKEYNERFSAKMSEKQTGVARKRAEKKDGIYVPRGPLSEETKKKISEGNIKFYLEHPDRVSEMSDRMKQFYEDHPEQKERLSRVLKISWGLREAKPVRKKMSKFFGKPDISAEEFAKMSLSKEDKTLKEFWAKNGWAKEQWSKAMVHGWEIVKAEEAKEIEQAAKVERQQNWLKEAENVSEYSIRVFPETFVKDIVQWAEKNGYDPRLLAGCDRAFVSKEGENVPPSEKIVEGIVTAYYDSQNDHSIQANMFQVALTKSMYDILNNMPKDETKRTEKDMCACALVLLIKRQIFTPDFLPRKMETDILADVFIDVVRRCHEMDIPELAKVFEGNLDESYQISKDYASQDPATRENGRRAMRRIFLKTQKAVHASGLGDVNLNY